MKNINLGCGRFPIPGKLNVDWDPKSGAEVIHDLNHFPYPFTDGDVDEIEANHVLEHLSHPFVVMKEIHRILKPGGVAKIRVPHFSRGFTHPEHVRGFGSTFPLYFRPDFQGGYMGYEFELKSMRLTWMAQPYLVKTLVSLPAYLFLRLIGSVISTLANISPDACSKLWCYWVGGFDEIEFVFVKPVGTETEKYREDLSRSA